MSVTIWRSSVAVVAAAGFLLLLATACSSATPPATAANGSPVGHQAAPPPVPSLAPSPTAPPTPSVAPTAPAVLAPPATVAVAFSGMRPGTYPVHLHSRCDGRQNFHIAILSSLQVTSAGHGAISVPGSYFGRGLCLIVYTSPTLYAVLTTRPI